MADRDIAFEAPGAEAREGMVRIVGGTFHMGSNHHYPEEAPRHPVRVDGFWIDRNPVTNREFAQFVDATGHVTTAEIAPDPRDYPGALPDMCRAVPGRCYSARSAVQSSFSTGASGGNFGLAPIGATRWGREATSTN